MKSMIERFEEKYVKIAGVDCWIWTGARHTFGYGNFWTGKKYDVAHRVSYALYVGEIPQGMNVLHKCDNPSCIRPDHLFIGTDQDNIYDKCMKGRARGPKMVGEKNPSSKISSEIVLLIRADKRAHRVICNDYGISKTQVGRIKRNESWA